MICGTGKPDPANLYTIPRDRNNNSDRTRTPGSLKFLGNLSWYGEASDASVTTFRWLITRGLDRPTP